MLGTGRLDGPVVTVVALFCFGGWDHPDLAMQTPVVPPVDVLEDGVLELFETARRPSRFDQFGFELLDCGPGEGVVVGVAEGADRRDDAGSGQRFAVADGEVLPGDPASVCCTSPVRVGRPRVQIASSSSSARMCPASAQPTIRREYTAIPRAR